MRASSPLVLLFVLKNQLVQYKLSRGRCQGIIGL
jgi:hypothetical protein